MAPIDDALNYALTSRTCLAADATLAPAPVTPGREIFQLGPWVLADEGIALCISIRDTEHLSDAGIAASGGRRGDFDDNALADTITGLFRTEVIHDAGPWRSFAAAEYHAGPGRPVHHRAVAGTIGLSSNGAVRRAE